MYEAIICRITCRPHPNADRLQLADATGYSCIISKDHKDGDLGIVFPEGGQLAHEFCLANNLYRKHPDTGAPMGGYMEENRRVRAVKLRGAESDALWLPWEAVHVWMNFIGVAGLVPYLEPGVTLTEIQGHQLCQKYYTPATLRAMRSHNPATRKAAAKDIALPKHYDTSQLRNCPVPTGDVFITEKLHGTSAASGYVRVEQPLTWWAKALNVLPFVNFKPRMKLEYVGRTRNCVLDESAVGEKGKGYRLMAHDLIARHLREEEVWYYELVGFEDTGKPIMGPHKLDKAAAALDEKTVKRLKQQVGGNEVVYHYGCERDGRLPSDGDVDQILKLGKAPAFKIYVYRITLGGHELTYGQIVDRVTAIKYALPDHLVEFLHVVPLLAHRVEGTWSEGELREQCNVLTRGPSTQGGLPLREGVCVRVETLQHDGVTVDVHRALKHKGFLFCALENIKHNDPDYVDEEEAA